MCRPVSGDQAAAATQVSVLESDGLSQEWLSDLLHGFPVDLYKGQNICLVAGGLGVAPGANIGVDVAIFEATHGSAPKYKGQNKVNPTALILSAKLMLEHLGEQDAAQLIERWGTGLDEAYQIGRAHV